MDDIPYPVRINRYLLLMGYCSRRKADELIAKGEVSINGKVAELGSIVQRKDTVSVSKNIAALPHTYTYFAYNKPRGIVSHNPQKGERAVEDVSGLGKNVSPVGRLDKESRGLMLLTNDGRIVDSLLNPKYEHEKEYRVTVDKKNSNWFLRHMESGVDIEGYVTKPAKIKKKSDTTFALILTEGKRHQIRRMCAALGYQVRDLKRVRIGDIKLARLKEGDVRELTEKERASLFA
ncbi:23S rRNA pseudouridine synthase F [Candidatus Kaiserbacteria bacterium CG10_big_fil_rev_8_21_14_0_10_49_17]|uniref:Pseudouridine synthase n=1 Tax=Candidatus Kaiserbacteria bacterium CG10_big_fil_rev_8_21_14_0_10_49_17 TaxID=1974609 RepID=A0A2M6WER0_9BACT|nr:MAG: 23S rRNA pseudouridine synthase F [Candidatus Kaiserbacteria bacterium CG10_big_fil_rev_8_21_14_0_10_49_17]